MTRPSLNLINLADARKTAPKADKPVIQSVTKLITSILGDKAEGPTEFELEVQTSMKALALQENGEYDEDDNCIIFGGEEVELKLYAFVEDNDSDEEDAPEQYVNYQAVIRTFEPSRFYVGDVATNFKDALASANKATK